MSLYPWHQPLWAQLSADRSHLPHGLLLHGQAGTGKRSFALALAKWLLCASPHQDQACGSCASCTWFEQGGHPDFKLIEPAAESPDADAEAGKKGGKHITIHDIRQLGEFLALASHQGGWRVVVINPAETMNPAASNALLKTLEEPPRNVLLVLIADQPRRLLPTVLSRCRKIAMALPPEALAIDWLRQQGLADPVEPLREAGGAPLLALEYADSERQQRCRKFLDRLAQPHASNLLDLAQDYQNRLDEAWGWLSRWVCDLLSVQATGEARYFPAESERQRALAAAMRPAALWAMHQDLLTAGRWLRHPLNSKLLLESWLLRYAALLEKSHGC